MGVSAHPRLGVEPGRVRPGRPVPGVSAPPLAGRTTVVGFGRPQDGASGPRDRRPPGQALGSRGRPAPHGAVSEERVITRRTTVRRAGQPGANAAARAAGRSAPGGSSNAGVDAGELPVVGPREACPCGSGRRYKACHGVRRRPAPVLRPFAGRVDEPDLVALRELVPSASAPLKLSAEHLAARPEHADRVITLGTMLPQAVPALVRDDGTVLVAIQTLVSGLDASVDVAGALLVALDAKPGTVVDTPPASALVEVERRPTGLDGLPRLGDLLDPAPLTVTVHRGFEWWLPAPPEREPTAGGEPVERSELSEQGGRSDQGGRSEQGEAAEAAGAVTPEVAAALERANAGVVPTERLTSVTAAYWCSPPGREHLRWVMPHPEEQLLDALARLASAGELTVGDGSRYVGSFRADGLVVPVWDLAAGAGADSCEEPASRLQAALAEALADSTPLSAAQRRVRAGVVARSLTLR